MASIQLETEEGGANLNRPLQMGQHRSATPAAPMFWEGLKVQVSLQMVLQSWSAHYHVRGRSLTLKCSPGPESSLHPSCVIL